MSDNEDATPSLGNSEILSVQNSIAPPIPEFPQPSKEGSKVPSAVARQDAGDVLPNAPAGAILVKNSKIDEHEVASRIIEAASEPCDAEALAGGSSSEKVNCEFSIFGPLLVVCHVSEIRRVRIAMLEDGVRERLDLREPGAFPC
jgi:hypothetical protein